MQRAVDFLAVFQNSFQESRSVRRDGLGRAVSSVGRVEVAYFQSLQRTAKSHVHPPMPPSSLCPVVLYNCALSLEER